MKKLIPAICMLFIAASMFGTSTFAWFSMNSVVTATGMKVTAKSDTNLLISGDGFSFSQDVDLSTGTTTVLSPASAVVPSTDGELPTFYGIEDKKQGNLPSTIYKLERAKGSYVAGVRYYEFSGTRVNKTTTPVTAATAGTFTLMTNPTGTIPSDKLVYVCMKTVTGTYQTGVNYFVEDSTNGYKADPNASLPATISGTVYINATSMEKATGTYQTGVDYYTLNFAGGYDKVASSTYTVGATIPDNTFVVSKAISPMVIDAKQTTYDATADANYDFFTFDKTTSKYTVCDKDNWYDGKAFKMSADSKDYAVDTVFSDVTDKTGFVYSHALYLKSTTDITNNIKVSVKAEEEESRQLDTSLRLMMVFIGTSADPANLEDEQDTLLFAPITGATACKPIESLDDTTNEPELASTSESFTTSPSVCFSGFEANKVYKLMVYIYFEGEANDCKSVYTDDLVDTTFTVTFEVEQPGD